MLAAVIILAVLVLILCTPISADIIYNSDGLKVFVRISFKSIRLLPKDKKVQRQNKSVKHKKKKTAFSLSERIEIARVVLNTVRRLTKKLNAGSLRLYYVSAGDDPYETVARYNVVKTAVEAVYPLLDIKDSVIDIRTDFEAEKSELSFEFCLKVRLFWLLVAAPSAGFSVFKIIVKKLFEQMKGENKARHGEQTQRDHANHHVRYKEYG